eukprot:2769051-Amphidinium_carterae.1
MNSRSLERMFCRLTGVLMTSYFDDFPCIEAELTYKSASRVVEGILTLTGWLYDITLAAD